MTPTLIDLATPLATTAPTLLRIGGVSAADLTLLLDRAEAMRREPDGFGGELRGEGVALLFEKPSTRTRVSLQVAAHRLGALPIVLSPNDLQLDRGEPIEDTARVLSGYCCAVFARVLKHQTIERLAGAATVPVVNALSDVHHPLQALADVLTLRDLFGSLAGLHVAWVGDADNNVAHSLLEATALAGIHLTIASPAGYGPDAGVLAAAQPVAAAHGGEIVLTDDPWEGVAGAQAVFTDVWVSMGQEADAATRQRDLAPYAVTEALLDAAGPDAAFLHCLPAVRGQEVEAAVLDGPRSAAWLEAENRLPTSQAVLSHLVNGVGGAA